SGILERGTKRVNAPRARELAVNEYTLSALEQETADDLDWAETAPEVQQHHGQLVVVRRRRILAVGTDRAALVAQAMASEPCGPEELVVIAVPRPDLSEIPH